MHLKTVVFMGGVVTLLVLVVACRQSLRALRGAPVPAPRSGGLSAEASTHYPGRRMVLTAIPVCVVSMMIAQVLFFHSGRALFSSLVPLALSLCIVGLPVLGQFRLYAWIANPACLIVGAIGLIAWPAASAAVWAWPFNHLIMAVYAAFSGLLFVGCVRYVNRPLGGGA